MADDARRRASAGDEEEEMEDAEDDVDDGELPAGMVADIVPEDMRGLRACMYCSLIQSFNQFLVNGCANCPFLKLIDDKERIRDCTSSSFTGTIALMDPQQSWVARWQRTSANVPGVYAVGVTNRLPEDIIEELRDAGIAYRPRDGHK